MRDTNRGVCGEVYAHDFHVMFVLVGMALGLGFALALVLPVFSAARVSCLQDYLVLRFGSRLPSVLLLLSNLVRYVVGVGLSLHLVSLCVAALTRLPPRLTAPTIAILALLFASVGGLEFSGSGSGSRLQKVLLLTSTALALVIATVDLGGLAKVLQHADLGNKLLIQGLDTETRSRHGTWAAGVLGLALGVKLYGFHQANLRRAVSLSSFAAVGSAMFLSLLPIAFVFLLAAYGGVLAAQLYPAHETTGSIHVSVCVRNLGMASRDALKIRNNFRYMRLTLDQVLPTLVMEQLEFIPGFAGFFLAIVISTAITDMASRYNLLAAILWEQSFSSLFPKIILSPALPTSRRPTPPRAPSMPPTASSLGHSVSTNPEILSLTLEKGDNNAALRPLSSSAAPPPPPPLPPELLREENKKRKCFLFIYKLVICGVSGIVSVGVSVGASHAGVGVWQLWQTTTGVMAGPVVGLFLGALFLPCLSSTSVVFGCTVGWVINSWLFLGSWLSGTTGGLQPLSPHPIPKATLQHIMDKHNLTFESIARLNPSFDCNNMATELLYCPINFLYTTREGVMSTIQHITDVEDTGDRPFEDSTRVYQSYSPERNIYQSDHVPITDKTFNKRLSEEISGTSNSNELYEQGAIEASTEQKSNLRGTQELVDIKSKHNIYPSYKEWLNVSRDSDSRDFFNGLNTSRNEIIPSVSDPRGKSQVSNKTATNGLSLVEQKSLRESNSKELNVFLKNEPERQMDFKDTTLQSRTHLIDLFQQIHLSQSIQKVTTVNKTSNINTSIEGSFENATQIVDEELHVDEINLTTQSLDQNKLSLWYNTSYCYYNSIGTMVSFMAAVVFSILTGSCHPLPPNKDVVSPISYKLFLRLRCPEFSTLFPSCSSQRTIYPIQPSAPADMLHTSKHSERYTTRALSIIQETSGL
ncbi:uncharacterized protein LOC143027244 isoform X2 [Oratosquilla oratoria]|uniref:uncharacterized protein LOC143027244 isoform X2 n=1 Tax=Oratosquilla oratoria TaxID=337810 RepID=UPI003F77309F